jgi:hypothetical protein
MAMKSLQVLLCSALAVGLAVPVAAHAQTRVEETAPGTTNYPGTVTITYTGKWHQTEVQRNWSGGTAAVSPWGPNSSDDAPTPALLPAASVTLNFSGTGVSWIGARGPQTGIAEVFLSECGQPFRFLGTVDTYAPQEEIQAVNGTLSGLANCSHTLKIVVTGTRNPSSSNNQIIVDAFDIEGNPSGRAQEDSQAAVTYQGIWIRGDASRPGMSGGTFAYSVGNPQLVERTTRAVLTFRGTQVTWIGARGPQTGIANVYLDGIKVATVDTVSPDGQEHLQQPLFTSNMLPAGIHTLAIEVPGTPTTRPIVVVDAFDVTP